TAVLNFLDRLQSLIGSEPSTKNIIVGADPRMGQLAMQFMIEQRRLPHRALLYELSFTQLQDLVNSDKPADKSKLIECLRALRAMLEQHSRADIASVFGEE
ncbi:MAG: hypothetical protein L0287_28880, partial [Anaerolineae bacterium]|nr:hypothetical protein [Anaerolineae bacterium]